MPSCLRVKEREFIRDVSDGNLETLYKKYTPSYRKVLKYSLLQKRRFLADDLLMIDSVLDKLQTL